MILVIDNYDSFVHNLVQYLGELGEAIEVYRNDQITVEGVRAARPQAVLISPGPGRPHDAGVSLDLIRSLAGEVPILGVCLGHQVIGEALGASVVRARQIVHGKTSLIHHDGKTVFQGLANPFPATRYHSLVVSPEGLPDCFQISAWTEDGLIMGLRHKQLPAEGVQFHPESILTAEGMKLLANFVRMSCGQQTTARGARSRGSEDRDSGR